MELSTLPVESTCLGVFAVSVMHQVTKSVLMLLKLPDKLSCLLSDPESVRVPGHTSQVNAACMELDKEKHDYRFEENGFQLSENHRLEFGFCNDP